MKAWEEASLPDVSLNHNFGLCCCFKSVGLTSAAVWLRSTLRRYRCLAIKYCGSWKEQTHLHHNAIILSQEDLLFLCPMVCVLFIFYYDFFLKIIFLWFYSGSLQQCVWFLVFFTSVVGNLKPQNGICLSSFPNSRNTGVVNALSMSCRCRFSVRVYGKPFLHLLDVQTSWRGPCDYSHSMGMNRESAARPCRHTPSL